MVAFRSGLQKIRTQVTIGIRPERARHRCRVRGWSRVASEAAVLLWPRWMSRMGL